jgi:hypothetical protein
MALLLSACPDQNQSTTLSENVEHVVIETHMRHRRKLRVIVITMGGERRDHIENLFAHPNMRRDFEAPVFMAGVPSRSIRSRMGFFDACNQAGLIPTAEWQAFEKAEKANLYKDHPYRFFECLDDVPVTPGRRGCDADIKLHYSAELWRKAKTLNRGRAVLGCTLAHLMALRKLTEENFDLILEDNVRCSPADCAKRIWEAMDASDEWSEQTGDSSTQCHMRYVGWLGSVPNLRWIYESHVPRRGHCLESLKTDTALFPFPRTHEIEDDLLEAKATAATLRSDYDEETGEDEPKLSSREPGGNPIWGSYGYWMSKQGYQTILTVLQKDVGALLWKGKRARHYSVKPVDKMMPRQIIAAFGQSFIHLTTKPSFFRAPMLTSKIHTKWDPEFCKSTQFQLNRVGLQWSDLWLTKEEESIVDHYLKTGIWLTSHELEHEREES